MDEERIAKAMARIEAATDRIADSAKQGSANAELVQKHESLREEAAIAISQIDRLIGTIAT